MKKKIVIVDDDKNSCFVWEKWLKDRGYEVLVINDSLQALELIREAIPQLLLIDILLPGKDGLKLSQEIREFDALQSIPIIFMSAIYKRADIKSYLQHISDSFLEKPFNKEMLFSKVREILEEEEEEEENLEIEYTAFKSAKQPDPQSGNPVSGEKLSKTSHSPGSQVEKNSSGREFHIDLPDFDDSPTDEIDTVKTKINSKRKSDSDIQDELNELLKKSKF